MFPEYLVNRWIGHTQQVAEAHYTQTLSSDFIDAYNAEKAVAKTVAERAGMKWRGVEVENSDIAATSFISITCDNMQDDAKEQNSQKWRGQDSNL